MQLVSAVGSRRAMLPLMARQARVASGGLVYHVLNRAVGRLSLLQKPEDYDAFERVLVEAHLGHPMRIVAHCLMPNHRHLVLYPRADGQLTAFVRRLIPVTVCSCRLGRDRFGVQLVGGAARTEVRGS